MPFSDGGLRELDNAVAAVNVAKYAAGRVRRRMGYLISPEQDADLRLIEAAIWRLEQDYYPAIRAELYAAFQLRRGRAE